jgi:hypothetical protein
MINKMKNISGDLKESAFFTNKEYVESINVHKNK